MASRLSEDSVKAVYDAGHQALLVQNDANLSLIADSPVDLDELLLQEDPEAAVQAVAPLELYKALKHYGVEDHLDVLPLMSDEQVQRSFDYEAWEGDRLEPLKTCRWLQLFKEVSEEQMALRFKGLEEELQLALLSPLVEVIDEDAYEKLPDNEQDELNRLPCNTLYYRIKTADDRVETTVRDLVDAMLGVDLQYAYSMLAHATYVPPTEQEDMAARFRKARIEEDGFVTYEESLEAFRRIDLRELERKAPAATRAVEAASAEPFLVSAMKHGAAIWTPEQYAQVVGAYAFLANTLAAAAQVETDDLGAMRKVLQQAQALAGLGLEHLSHGDRALATELLAKEHPQTLFRAGLALVGELQDGMLQALAEAGLTQADGLRRLWELQRPGAILSRLDADVLPILGLRRTELLRGLFNRFPVRPEATTSVDGVERTVFGPVGSRAALADFAAQLDGLRGILHLASKAGVGTLRDLDRQMTTVLANGLLGRKGHAPLHAEDLRRVVALPREAAQALTNDLLAGYEQELRAVLTAPALHVAMGELTDLALRMHLAREHDMKSGGAGSEALAALVDKESKDA
jgi:hypothetical protein